MNYRFNSPACGVLSAQASRSLGDQHDGGECLHSIDSVNAGIAAGSEVLGGRQVGVDNATPLLASGGTGQTRVHLGGPGASSKQLMGGKWVTGDG